MCRRCFRRTGLSGNPLLANRSTLGHRLCPSRDGDPVERMRLRHGKRVPSRLGDLSVSEPCRSKNHEKDHDGMPFLITWHFTVSLLLNIAITLNEELAESMSARPVYKQAPGTMGVECFPEKRPAQTVRRLRSQELPYNSSQRTDDFSICRLVKCF
jgi:hypothetical protein